VGDAIRRPGPCRLRQPDGGRDGPWSAALAYAAIVGGRLTQAAWAHGLALALPEKVAMARPTGVGRALTAYDLPIEGRDEWLATARRLA
jgi:hypothetical protein